MSWLTAMRRKFIKLISLLMLLSIFLYVTFSELAARNDPDQGRFFVSINQLEQQGEISQVKTIASNEIALPAASLQQLAQGETVAIRLSNQQLYYYRQLSETTLLQVGPVFAEAIDDSWLRGIIIGFYIALISIVLALIWPVFRDLHLLQQQAIAFGEAPQALPRIISKRSPIAPLAQTFNRMSRQVMKLVTMHTQLSQTISHEVRTPLARIRFALALMQQGDDPKYQHQIQRDLKLIENLANSYLAFARLDYLDKHPLVAFELTPFVASVKRHYEIIDRNLQLTFIHDGKQGFGDQEALFVVLQNLISNAMKYAHQQIIVRFTANTYECLIEVEDDGAGFADNDDIFAAFVRQDVDAKGFGLGLYIVKQIAQWHGAHLTCETSSHLGGAKLSMRWPKQRRLVEP